MINGFTLFESPVKTPAINCTSICSSMSKCVGFSHNMTSGVCYLKNSTSSVRATGIDSWVKCGSSPFPNANFVSSGARKLLQIKNGKFKKHFPIFELSRLMIFFWNAQQVLYFGVIRPLGQLAKFLELEVKLEQM